MVTSTVKNIAYDEHVADIMKNGLLKGSFSDVILSVPGEKKVIKCHKSILSRCSPFLSVLLEQHEDQEEPVNITLAEVEYREVMAMMNLIYVGKVSLSDPVLFDKTRAVARDFLGIAVLQEVDTGSPSSQQEPARPAVSRDVKRRRLNSSGSGQQTRKRPLMIRGSPAAQSPIIFFLSAPSATGGGSVTSSLAKSEDLAITTEEPSNQSVALNSYQKAKQRCADKYKCDICCKGFPLSCLLQRHKRTHADHKPFQCNYCQKSFSSKTSLNHHLFMRHSEEQSRKIENGKKLIENLRLERSGFKRDDLDKVDSLTGSEAVFGLESCASVQSVQNMEILGVQDITQQIEVQIGRKESELEDKERCASVIVSSSEFILPLDWWKK